MVDLLERIVDNSTNSVIFNFKKFTPQEEATREIEQYLKKYYSSGISQLNQVIAAGYSLRPDERTHNDSKTTFLLCLLCEKRDIILEFLTVEQIPHDTFESFVLNFSARSVSGLYGNFSHDKTTSTAEANNFCQYLNSLGVKVYYPKKRSQVPS